jgi:hypothetical protein
MSSKWILVMCTNLGMIYINNLTYGQKFTKADGFLRKVEESFGRGPRN